MHRTIRRRPLFALCVGFALITFSVLLNACQPLEARTSSSLVIATARPWAASTVTVAPSPATPDQAAVRFLRAFYIADYRQCDHWLGVPLNVVDRSTPSPKTAIQLRSGLFQSRWSGAKRPFSSYDGSGLDHHQPGERPHGVYRT